MKSTSPSTTAPLVTGGCVVCFQWFHKLEHSYRLMHKEIIKSSQLRVRKINFSSTFCVAFEEMSRGVSIIVRN